MPKGLFGSIIASHGSGLVQCVIPYAPEDAFRFDFRMGIGELLG